MKKIFTYIFIVVLLSGCGSTLLTVGNSDVDIYVENVHKGKGVVSITRAGSPQKRTVVAKYHGETVGEVKIRRRFDVVTAFVGLYTYGFGFFLCWRYPAVVYIPVKLPEQKQSANKDKESFWMRPPRMWNPKQ